MEDKTYTIIIADDDKAMLMLSKKMLADSDYNIITASNGPEVLEAVRDIVPDLFLLDVTMPKMDGIEVCRRLKKDERLAHIPVIFFTVKGETYDLIKGFEAGAADYISKPVKQPELIARVRTHIKLYHSMLELERLNQLALDANPSTGLPGNNSINEAITRAVENGLPLCVIYSDLDNFKAYNDKYGFGAGDNAIRYAADVIGQGVNAVCGPGCFIGHIGGDDYTVLVPSNKAQAVAEDIVRRFDEGIGDFYEPEDLRAGGIIARDRQGQVQEFPIMSISLAGVDLSEGTFKHYIEVADACAEVKKKAKEIPGSSIFFNRRKIPR